MAKVLPVTEKDLIAHLLETQANEFLDGAECIARVRQFGTGDSAYFLRLMAIELYFKFLYLKETESLIFGHDLREIFDVMPKYCRNDIYRVFNEKVSNQLGLQDFRDWLKYLGDLFTKIRYPFDEFREMPVEEYESRIKKFLAAPANDFTDASIVYHMDRIEALISTLLARVELQHSQRRAQ
jgi:hypothetical protein